MLKPYSKNGRCPFKHVDRWDIHAYAPSGRRYRGKAVLRRALKKSNRQDNKIRVADAA